MPDGGSGKTAKLHRSPSDHPRTLQRLHETLFAAEFRALETYGERPPPPLTVSELIGLAEQALAWHRAKEIEAAAELAARRQAGSNIALIDRTARAVAFHRDEYTRIERHLLLVRD